MKSVSFNKSIVFSAFICMLFCACKKDMHNVNYSVSCETCEVSYYNDQNEWILREIVTGSFTYDFEFEQGTEHSPGPEQSVKVNAQNVQGSTGTIQVKLTVNGTVIKDTTGTGEHSMVWADWAEEE